MAKDNRDAVMAFIFQQEGGFTADPKDPGNWTGGAVGSGVLLGTKFGVAANSHPSLDIEHLTREQASAIYKAEYWDAIGGDRLRPGEDLAVMDPAVNSGPAKALSWWRAAGGAAADAETVIHKISANRLSFLHALGSWSRFGGAWGRRVAACEALAIQMLHGASSPAVLETKGKAARSSAKAEAVKASIGVAGAIAAARNWIAGHAWLTTPIAIVVAAAAAVLIFNAWRQSQRGDALEASLKEWAAQKQALEAMQKAEAAQKAALQARIDRATAEEAVLKAPVTSKDATVPSATIAASPTAVSSNRLKKP